MQLAVEILDHIFSFLVFSRQTLIACSKDPILSPFVSERHLYYHLVVRVDHDRGRNDSNFPAFQRDHLSSLISKNPCILRYVRILQIQDESDRWPKRDPLDEFAYTLLMFPLLERIILNTQNNSLHSSGGVFQSVLRDRFNLPTIKEVELLGGSTIPLHLFSDHCKNLEHLSLLRPLPEAEDAISYHLLYLPQPKSLTLRMRMADDLLEWLKPQITELKSLKLSLSHAYNLPSLSELLEVCSQTLSELEVDVKNPAVYQVHSLQIIDQFQITPEIHPAHANLQKLTIRTGVHLFYCIDQTPNYYHSWLPPVAKVIQIIIPRHLVLCINVKLYNVFDSSGVDLSGVFSPLNFLGSASVSIPRIDLYIHTGGLPCAITRAQLLSSLEDYEGIMRLIRKGALVIHSEKILPPSVVTSGVDCNDVNTRPGGSYLPAVED